MRIASPAVNHRSVAASYRFKIASLFVVRPSDHYRRSSPDLAPSTEPYHFSNSAGAFALNTHIGNVNMHIEFEMYIFTNSKF